jgi:hypothetical protein
MAASAAVKAWYRKSTTPPDRIRVSCASNIRVSLPPRTAMAAIKAILCREHYCRVVEEEGDIQMFQRGDFSIRRLDATSDLDWRQVPVILGLQYASEPSETLVRVHTAASTDLVFSDGMEESFYSLAAKEVDVLVLALGAWIEASRIRQPEPEPKRCPDDASAYATLNLKRGAAWPEIQEAYREASKRYHPDRLTGQNVPSHLVELAVERFKSATAAYQTLKRLHGR